MSVFKRKFIELQTVKFKPAHVGLTNLANSTKKLNMAIGNYDHILEHKDPYDGGQFACKTILEIDKAFKNMKSEVKEMSDNIDTLMHTRPDSIDFVNTYNNLVDDWTDIQVYMLHMYTLMATFSAVVDNRKIMSPDQTAFEVARNNEKKLLPDATKAGQLADWYATNIGLHTHVQEFNYVPGDMSKMFYCVMSSVDQVGKDGEEYPQGKLLKPQNMRNYGAGGV